MKHIKINSEKVTVTRVGYFGAYGQQLTMAIDKAISYIEAKNTILFAAGSNNNKNFQEYFTILPHFGK